GAFSRRNHGLYVDVESQLTDELLLGGAVRYEDFSSFGDTTNYKVSASYQLTDSLTLRGSTSTGFRAPTQGQASIVSTQTYVKDGEITQVQTLPSNKLGEGELKPEESESYTMGVVIFLGDVEITADYFNIEVTDRIAITRQQDTTQKHIDNMTMAGIPNADRFDKVSYFTNDFDTETEGVDIVATYGTDFFGGTTDFSMAYNWTDTVVTNEGEAIGEEERKKKVKTLQEGLPHHRATLTVAQSWQDIGAFIRTNYFGSYYAEHAFSDVTTDAAPAVTVDAEATYRLTEHLSLSAGGQNIFDREAERLDDTEAAKYGAVYYESSPMGINGAFWYLKADYNF
ncbi:MAG: TonB-dependent receptor, partial [Porticoccaceae bacterium]|nr:TonB-dependent receptor [Porticoccaceae bacterium]